MNYTSVPLQILANLLQDKILLSGEGEMQQVQVTNDGATILKAIGVDNPAAKVLVGMYIAEVFGQ